MNKRINFKTVSLSVATSLMIIASIMIGLKLQENKSPTAFRPKAAEKTYETTLALNPEAPQSTPSITPTGAIISPTSILTHTPTPIQQASAQPSITPTSAPITPTVIVSNTPVPTTNSVSPTNPVELPASGIGNYSIITIGVALLIIMISFVF